jgi:hypothetical protein
MVSYKFLAATVLGFALISAVLTASYNQCGSAGDAMPSQSSQCTANQNNTLGTCCYIRADVPKNATLNETVSACFLLPPGLNQTLVEEAAKALGGNSSFTCSASYMAVSTLLVFLYALMF